MDLRLAVSETVSYADYFNFPLLPEEIHHWLICSDTVSLSRLRPFLPRKLTPAEHNFRSKTDQYSREKILHARRLISFLRFVPGLKLVALTGSVAANNSKKDDDIDLLFITSPHTLWLVRPVVITLISLFFRRRHPMEDHSHAPNAFCPNLWLDTEAISIPTSKHSLYTAHEVLQILPLLDRGDTFLSFIKANAWTKKYLANAYTSLTSKSKSNLPGKTSHRHSLGESSLFCSIVIIFLAPLNLLFFVFQFLYMFPKKTSETVYLHSAFLHTTDFASRLDAHLKK